MSLILSWFASYRRDGPATARATAGAQDRTRGSPCRRRLRSTAGVNGLVAVRSTAGPGENAIGPQRLCGRPRNPPVVDGPARGDAAQNASGPLPSTAQRLRGDRGAWQAPCRRAVRATVGARNGLLPSTGRGVTGGATWLCLPRFSGACFDKNSTTGGTQKGVGESNRWDHNVIRSKWDGTVALGAPVSSAATCCGVRGISDPGSKWRYVHIGSWQSPVRTCGLHTASNPTTDRQQTKRRGGSVGQGDEPAGRIPCPRSKREAENDCTETGTLVHGQRCRAIFCIYHEHALCRSSAVCKPAALTHTQTPSRPLATWASTYQKFAECLVVGRTGCKGMRMTHHRRSSAAVRLHRSRGTRVSNRRGRRDNCRMRRRREAVAWWRRDRVANNCCMRRRRGERVVWRRG